MTADLDAIRARLAAATPGPWERRQRGTWAPEVAAPNITTPRGDHAPYSPAAVVSRGEFNGNLADLDLIANAPADLAALVDEVESLREWREKVALAGGLADDLRGEGRGIHLETDPDLAADHVAGLLSAAGDHDDCPVPCDEHDEQWEWPLSCEGCRGSGVAGPSIVDFLDGEVPNNLAHPGECGVCGGDGRDHNSLHNLVTMDEAKQMEAVVLDEVESLRAAVERVRALHAPESYYGEPGDDDCPHDADYDGPRHFYNADELLLCEDTASEEKYCGGCSVDEWGEHQPYPCPTLRALDGAE